MLQLIRFLLLALMLRSDLKSANLLVDGNNRVKVADFGHSTNETHEDKTFVLGTRRVSWTKATCVHA